MLPAVRIFRLSQFEKELEARHLALARAAIVLGRKVLCDNPRPKIPKITQHEIKKPSPQHYSFEMQTAASIKRKAAGERRFLERQHLSVADKHVAKAERVVREQVALIASLRCNGQDTKLAEETMRVFEANLQVMREHRELIIGAIEEADDSR
ncbi:MULTISPECIES: hypothetical protein [unclassified Bradyrhizobium]